MRAPNSSGNRLAQTFLCLALFVSLQCFPCRAAVLDLREATIVRPASATGPERKAITMLQEEVQKRSQVEWPLTNNWPKTGLVIAIGSISNLPSFPGPFAEETTRLPVPANSPEGFRLWVARRNGLTAVLVEGNDPRGVLFGVGRLLRELRMARGTVELPDTLSVATSPKYRLRGHQLGYRPKCNSYDAWDLPQWEQYYRDLAVFGCNAVELIPPRSDDDADSPHFHRPPFEMMAGMSHLADEYGLDVWIWYPAMDADYSKAEMVQAALLEWAEVFRRLPRIDAVFVPGGDPGHTRPRYLLNLLEKQTANLHRFHPKAQMWVSPQSFNQEWLEEFLSTLHETPPTWLSGIVYGPQVRIPLARLRELVPAQYPIRNYPDITHSRQCQFPVPDWDVAYAVTEARECINPRPQDESTIFQQLQPDTIGFISYSEGCNDDVNKCVWSGLGWEPDLSIQDLVRQYADYFIGSVHAEAFASGLMDLEQNWRGALATNKNVEATLAHFQELERAASPFELRNWRFQQALFRAYYDAYVQRRLKHDTVVEQQAMDALAAAPTAGTVHAVADAQTILDRGAGERVAPELRARLFELGEALFQSIGMQLSVGRYKAIGIDRGASLDTADFPLNNRNWLLERFAAIRHVQTEPERLKAVEEILHWTEPGPGGFYDDLGNPSRQPHLVRPFGFAADPEAMRSVRSDFEEDLVADEPDEKTEGARRMSWMDHIESLYDAPVELRYTHLDPNAVYRVRVVYAGDNPKRKIRLVANGSVEIHSYLSKPVPFKPLEFSIPVAATRDGTLSLQWFGELGLGGNGRGCQVSEVWLLKAPGSASP